MECLCCYATLRLHRRPVEPGKSNGRVARRVHVTRHYAWHSREVNHSEVIMKALLVLLAAASIAQGQPAHHVLQATPKTVTWGRYDPNTPPVLRIKSGDIVEVHSQG